MGRTHSLCNSGAQTQKEAARDEQTGHKELSAGVRAQDETGAEEAAETLMETLIKTHLRVRIVAGLELLWSSSADPVSFFYFLIHVTVKTNRKTYFYFSHNVLLSISP